MSHNDSGMARHAENQTQHLDKTNVEPLRDSFMGYMFTLKLLMSLVHEMRGSYL